MLYLDCICTHVIIYYQVLYISIMKVCDDYRILAWRPYSDFKKMCFVEFANTRSTVHSLQYLLMNGVSINQ